MELIVSCVGVAVGIVGLAYGIYQNRLRSRIKRMALSQAWAMYHTTANALGWFLDYMREEPKPSPSCLSGQAHGRLDEAYEKAIQNLILQYDKVTPEMIDKWIDEGRLKKNDKARDDLNFQRQIIDD